jgi:hypothetical protein
MTPLGELQTFHVRPVPARDSMAETVGEVARSGGSILSAQVWYAPMLQMLPVRIRIEQDAETWIDLRLSEPPKQSAPVKPSPGAGTVGPATGVPDQTAPAPAAGR